MCTSADLQMLGAAHILQRADPKGLRIAGALRRGLDLLLDGQHTGRFAWIQLSKSEKAHASAVMDMEIQREFGFADGLVGIFAIGTEDASVVFSHSFDGWTVSDRGQNTIRLALWADDGLGRGGAGLIRLAVRSTEMTDERIDSRQIFWVHRDMPLPPNVLAQLSPPSQSRIFSQPSGQQRVNELFRVVTGQRITKSVVATVAQQEDYLKRVRYNGGARSHLRQEGIVILGDSPSHATVARTLEVAAPGPGEFVSLKLTRFTGMEDRPAVEIAGSRWCVWRTGDEIGAAPLI
jgi:hypothetical protein